MAVVLLLVAAAFGTIAWFGRGTYYVGLDGDRVTVFQGRPGGLFWYDPTVERRTDLHSHELPPARLDTLRDGKQLSSRGAADRYVENLRDESARIP